MRALPGRSSRTSGLEKPARVTRATVPGAQRERILRAAAELVAKRGYNDVSVELIVKRARVSFKTFYARFPNKEACFLELFEESFTAYETTVAEALDPEVEWPHRVLAALCAFLAEVIADPVLARACLVEAPTAGPAVLERYERSLLAFAFIFREGRSFSSRGEELPESLEETLAGSLLWSVYQRLIVGEVDQLEALLPSAAELVLRPYLGEEEARRLGAEAGAAAVGS
jgi:AcrR family transcriptional regulator